MPKTAAGSTDQVKKRPARKRVSSKGSVKRKAPTPLRERANASTWMRNQYLIALAVVVLMTGGSFGIGISDAGQIDVRGKIEERNDRVAAGETIEGESGNMQNKSIPVQETGDSAPNGGFVGAGQRAAPPPPPPPPPEPVATSTASSTDDGTATSSESVADEVLENEEEPVPEESAESAATSTDA